MSDYSDDDDFEEPPPPSPTGTDDDVVANSSDMQSLQSLMFKAKATLVDLKMGLQDVDVTNLETESIATPEPSPAPARLVTPSTPPPRYADRSSWITASRGEGQETRQVDTQDVRFKGVMVGESIGKQPARWKEGGARDDEDQGGGEAIVLGDTTR